MLLITAFCGGCSQTDPLSDLGAIGRDRAARLDARQLPDLPSDCRLRARAGVQSGDRLDVAVLKLDAALARQIARADRCDDWFDGLRSGLASAGVGGA